MPPPAKRGKQYNHNNISTSSQRQQQIANDRLQHQQYYENVSTPASAVRGGRGRGRRRGRRAGTGRGGGVAGSAVRILRQTNGIITRAYGGGIVNNWAHEMPTVGGGGGRRQRAGSRGRPRASRAIAGRVSRWKDDSASVASSSGRRGGRPPRQQSSTSASAAGRPKRPWEGSEDEEDELSKRYGFGRSFLFSEEEEDEEEEEEDEGMGSDQTDLDTDDDGGGSEAKALPSSAAVPPSASSPFGPFSSLDDEDDDMEEELLAQLSPDQVPPLVLSDSSVDLLIYKEHLMDTLEVYEVLLNYGSVLQLSPFLFEDFCAAIRSPKQSLLLCEIHLAFLRLFFREEDSEHTIFAATETTVSVNILIQLMDSMSFAEVLRHYVESDAHFPADVLHILQHSNYPFVELDKRLRVLKWMCERFFQFDLIKRIVGGTHKTVHDEQCRSCGKAGGGFGKLLACAECEAVYHVHCDADLVPGPTPPPQPQAAPANLQSVPSSASDPTTATSNGGGGAVPTAAATPVAAEDDPNWRCPLCRIYVSGITDENCLLPGQVNHRNLRRIMPVGKDRHGRLYWFMVRRIFVQEPQSGELYYYSTLPQLFDLINHLDPHRFERRLCRRLGDLLPSVAMQMHATLELTDQRWRLRCAAAKVPEHCPSRPYLHSDNVHRMSRILGTVLMEEHQQDNKTEQQQQKQQFDDAKNGSDGATTAMDTTETPTNGGGKGQPKREHNDEAGDALQIDDGSAAAESTDAVLLHNGGGNEEDEEDEDGKKIDVTSSTNDAGGANANNNNNELLQMVKTLLCIKDGHLVATFWSAGMTEVQLLDYCSYFVDIKPPPEELLAREGVPSPGARTADDFWWWRTLPHEIDLLEELNRRLNRGFRLGFSDGVYLQYVNHYSANPDLCRSAAARKMERDKRKYMSSRFSITEQGEFSWHLPKGRFDHHGTAEDMLRCVQLNLRRLVDRIPDALMHRGWVLDGEKGNFLRRLAAVRTIDSLRDLLMLYEAAIRRPVFLPIWWQSLSATRFIRITSEWRERRQLLENARKKEEKALQQASELDPASALAAGIVWVRYSLYGGVPPRHQLWRTMKDEQYRLNGLGALGGWQWVSSTLLRRFRPLPEKPHLNIASSSTASSSYSLATRKALRLEDVAQRLLSWRLLEDSAHRQMLPLPSSMQPTYSSSSTTAVPVILPCRCYSTSCRLLTSTSTAGGGATTATVPAFGSSVSAPVPWPCYSPSCQAHRRNWMKYAHRTRGVVKAKPPLYVKSEPPRTNEVLGEKKAFPFPQPNDFKSGAGKRSILKLPKWFLKRLARQGGTNPKCSLHFFHQTAKSNPTVWPYPCVRPLFFYCWRYLTSGAKSIHALALRFRLLYACIRWPDMSPDPDDEDPRVWSHQADYDEVRMVVSHRENPPDGYYEQYLLKVDQYMVEDGAEDEHDLLYGTDDDDSANYRQSSVRESDYYAAGTGRGRRGSGRRRRQRGGGSAAASYRGGIATDQLQRQRVSAWRSPPRRVRTLTRWIDGVDLKLYEISWYWSDWLRNAMTEAARAREEQRRRVAMDAASMAQQQYQQQPPQLYQQHHQYQWLIDHHS
ncbi:hypothetical protein niasHT_000132 [Heterodera trifolii]|uniref:DDT domain-containing protein n=1 Tax=Heterodera trifolii TaxID=157864 RepID=A0ABD2M354_9BILA